MVTITQGCSLGLDVSVSRPIFPMSRSRLGLGEMWDGLGLGLVSGATIIIKDSIK